MSLSLVLIILCQYYLPTLDRLYTPTVPNTYVAAEPDSGSSPAVTTTDRQYRINRRQSVFHPEIGTVSFKYILDETMKVIIPKKSGKTNIGIPVNFRENILPL